MRAVDAQGRGVSGVPINWVWLIGTGVITPLDLSTNANGEARAQVRLGMEVGRQAVQANSPGLPPSAFSFTASPPPLGSEWDFVAPTLSAEGITSTGTPFTLTCADVAMRVSITRFGSTTLGGQLTPHETRCQVSTESWFTGAAFTNFTLSGEVNPGGNFILRTDDAVFHIAGNYAGGAMIGLQGSIEIRLPPPYPSSIRASGAWAGTWVAP